MKILQLFIPLFFIAFTGHAQCDSNYLFKKGNKIDISTYWRMGFGKFKELPKLNYEVKNVNDSNGWTSSKIIKQAPRIMEKVFSGKNCC